MSHTARMVVKKKLLKFELIIMQKILEPCVNSLMPLSRFGCRSSPFYVSSVSSVFFFRFFSVPFSRLVLRFSRHHFLLQRALLVLPSFRHSEMINHFETKNIFQFSMQLVYGKFISSPFLLRLFKNGFLGIPWAKVTEMELIKAIRGGVIYRH